ncbi:MAG: ribbon-helix-helix protein, CopG family [Chloroflexota bacterium]
MKRTTVMLDEAAYAELESYARRDGLSTGRLIRDAMELYLTERERQDAGAPTPLPSFVGMVDDPSVQGEDVEDFLAAWLPSHEEGERTAGSPPAQGDHRAGGG